MNNNSNPFANLFGKQQQSSNQSSTGTHQNIHSPSYHQNPYHSSSQQNYPSQQQGMTYNQNPNLINNQYSSMNQPQNSFSHNFPTKQQNKQQFGSYDTSINIETLSPKQLLCQCIDLATSMLKDLVDTYTQNNGLPCPYQGRKVVDFSYLANYLLDPARMDTVLSQFLAKDQQTIKSLVKSWVFEIKHIRNLWAHSQHIDYRLAFRGFDTLSLLFQAFGGHKDSALSKKIETYRRALLITQAKNGMF